jgi:hypothetical protein
MKKEVIIFNLATRSINVNDDLFEEKLAGLVATKYCPDSWGDVNCETVDEYVEEIMVYAEILGLCLDAYISETQDEVKGMLACDASLTKLTDLVKKFVRFKNWIDAGYNTKVLEKIARASWKAIEEEHQDE